MLYSIMYRSIGNRDSGCVSLPFLKVSLEGSCLILQVKASNYYSTRLVWPAIAALALFFFLGSIVMELIEPFGVVVIFCHHLSLGGVEDC